MKQFLEIFLPFIFLFIFGCHTRYEESYYENGNIKKIQESEGGIPIIIEVDHKTIIEHNQK